MFIPKKHTIYSVRVGGRDLIHGGLPSTFIGPFLDLFDYERVVGLRIADQTSEYLRNGRILATALDLLLDHLLTIDAYGDKPADVTVNVEPRAMEYLEDLDREAHNFVNVILNPYIDRSGAGVTVFDIEGHPSIAMAMAAANDRIGGSAEVWTLDLTTIEVAMKQMGASEPGSYEIERRAAELLKDMGAEFWHSGGGIMLCSLRFPKFEKDMLVSESEISPGRFWLGIYDVANGEHNEEDEMFDLLDSEQLVTKVKEIAKSFEGWTRPDTRQ